MQVIVFIILLTYIRSVIYQSPMKKLLILASSFFVFTISHSQLLRSEVYDFAIGDYYGIKHRANASGNPNIYTWKIQMFHILDKELSVTGDSVTYSAQRQTYFPSIQGSTPSLEIDTFQFSHFNLNSAYSPTDFDQTFGNSLEFFWYIDTTNCYVADSSSSSSNFCPGVINQKMECSMQIDIMDSCNSSKPYVSSHEVFSHAGGPYGGQYNPADPSIPARFIDLDYVNHNGMECGTFPDYFLSLKELDQLKISVFPNPAKDKLAVTGIEAIKSFSITTSEGKMVDHVRLDALNNLDVSKLTAGIYFLRLTDNRDKSGMVRFMKE